MSESKHTPGPWRVVDGDWYIVDSLGRNVAAALYRKDLGPERPAIPDPDQEQRANAALIAEAPALRSALDGMFFISNGKATQGKFLRRVGAGPFQYDCIDGWVSVYELFTTKDGCDSAIARTALASGEARK